MDLGILACCAATFAWSVVVHWNAGKCLQGWRDALDLCERYAERVKALEGQRDSSDYWKEGDRE